MGVCAPLRINTPPVSVDARLWFQDALFSNLPWAFDRASCLNPLTQDFQLDFSEPLQYRTCFGVIQPYIGALADKYGSGRTMSAGSWNVVASKCHLRLHISAGVIVEIAGSGATLAAFRGHRAERANRTAAFPWHR